MEGVEIETGTTRSEVRVELGERGALAGTVLDAEGRPVPDAWIWISRHGEGGVFGRPRDHARSDTNGAFLLEDLDPGWYRLSQDSAGPTGGAYGSVWMSGAAPEKSGKPPPDLQKAGYMEVREGEVTRTVVREEPEPR